MGVSWRAAVVAAMLWPGSAWATNGFRPRTLPTFELEQCLTIVDREAPQLHVDFSIPFEDAVLTSDELADSRTFQFFALCRDLHAELEKLPNWIAMDDAQRSLDTEAITELPPADDVLDLHDEWMGCATRLVADDDRLPITCEATAAGIDFDTSVLPAGNYVVRGYTFEPAVNVWVTRRGVVQVRDGGEALPVVSLMSPPRDDWQAFEVDGFDVVGCMDGPPGTSVRVEWASLIALEWRVLEELDAADGTFAIHFAFPPEAVGQPVIFRAVAESPSGAQWTAFAPGTLLVLPGDGESYDPDPPPGIDYCDVFPDPPEGTDGDSSGDGSTSVVDSDTDADTDTDTDAAMQGQPAGCACRAGRERSGTALPFVLALGALARRRRRSARALGGRSP